MPTSGVGAAVGTSMSIDGDGVIATVLREGRPHWMADITTRGGAIIERGLELGITSAIGCPVLVGGRVWGALGAAKARRQKFSPGTEARLAQFAELVATAIANADARAEVQRLADEQAALRRVATLVAAGYFRSPAGLTRHARGWMLHLPARWPRHGDYITALNAIRPLPAAA